jgi:hypothetical protein
MPRLRWLVTGLSSGRPGLNPKPVHVGFLVDKVALGQVFALSTSVFPLVIFDQYSTLIHPPVTNAI